MKDSNSWITPKQAAEILECSTRAVQKYITSGKLCASKEDGKYFIDKSEFFRVFPKAHKKEREGNSALQEAERTRLEHENEMLKDANSQKDREIEFLRSQIETHSQEKNKILDALVSQTKLLEHQKQPRNTAKGSWRGIFSKTK